MTHYEPIPFETLEHDEQAAFMARSIRFGFDDYVDNWDKMAHGGQQIAWRANFAAEQARIARQDPETDSALDRITRAVGDQAEVLAGPTRLKSGATFVLDDPCELDPIWGTGDEVLWASGEALLLVGPTGVGKTTLGLQVLAARLGILDEVLGWPVKPADKPVLYLAMDRPRQIRRAMRRLFGEEHRELLDERLVVWEGPLPLDLGRVPEQLLDTVQSAGAGTVMIDSLKDAAVKLTDDEVGGNYNRAVQFCLVEGVEVLGDHHQRKGQNGAKPTTLEDVYGSTWITAGAGSVVMLWGAAGDPLVEMRHLKQPAGEVGPLKIEHDHLTGTSSIYRGQVDALAMLRNAPNGITSLDLARLMFECEKPNDNQRKKAQRQLERLVTNKTASKPESARHGATGTVAARYYAVVADSR